MSVREEKRMGARQRWRGEREQGANESAEEQKGEQQI